MGLCPCVWLLRSVTRLSPRAAKGKSNCGDELPVTPRSCELITIKPAKNRQSDPRCVGANIISCRCDDLRLTSLFPMNCSGQPIIGTMDPRRSKPDRHQQSKE